MDALIQEFITQRPIALVGATNDPAKYGNVILKNLRGRGWPVFAINPKATMIDGEAAYPNLAALPKKPELVVFVVPPAIGIKVLDEVKTLDIDRVWLQPGAESPEILARAAELGLRVVHDACIMVLAARIGA
jgi:predicted CoA-binding protein